MKKTLLLSGLLSTALVMACAGDDGKDTAGATNPTGAGTTTSASGSGSDTDTTGMTNTSGGTGATTGASGTTGDTTGETGCSFLDCTTGGTKQCDIWNDDCPEGEKCMPLANDGGSAWNATECKTLDPNGGKPGDECKVEGSGVSGLDTCEKGAMCWNTNEEGIGYCVAFCYGDENMPKCEEAGKTCVVANNGVLILCLPGCDPLVQDCPGGDLCLPTVGGYACVLDASGEEGQYGDPCEFANACDPGLVCADAVAVPKCNAGGCCTPYCALSEPNMCPGAGEGQKCEVLYPDNPPVGFEDVGYCAIPQ